MMTKSTRGFLDYSKNAKTRCLGHGMSFPATVLFQQLIIFDSPVQPASAAHPGAPPVLYCGVNVDDPVVDLTDLVED